MKSDESLQTQETESGKSPGRPPIENEANFPESNLGLGNSYGVGSSMSGKVDDEFPRAAAHRPSVEKPLLSARHFYVIPLTVIIFIFILSGLLIHYYSLKQRQLDVLSAEDQRKSDQMREELRRESYHIREALRRESDRTWEEQRRETEQMYQERQQQLGYLRVPQKGGIERLPSRRPNELELDYELAFLVETSRIRLKKIDEVLEAIDKTESEIDRILESINSMVSAPPSELRTVDESESSLAALGLVKQQETIVKKDKYWLGEEIYNQLMRYQALNARYVSDTLVGPRGTDLSEVLKARDREKEKTLQLRRVFLDKEYSAGKLLRQPHQ